MKNFNKYASLALVACIGSWMASCDSSKDNDYFTLAPGDVNVPVYFQVQQTQKVNVGKSDTEYFFNIYRNSLSAPSTVNLIWSGDTQLFDYPTAVTFGDEDLMAELEVTFDPEEWEPLTPYSISVAIEGYETTAVTQNNINFEFTYMPMSEWAPFAQDPDEGKTGYGDFTFSNYYGGVEPDVLVEYCYSLVNEKEQQYRILWMVTDENYDPVYDDDGNIMYEQFLYFESNDGGETFSIPEQPFAYNAQYDEIVYVSDTWNGQYVGDSYFDDVTGTFHLATIYYISQGYFGVGYETCTLYGYLDTNDYSVTVKDLGYTNVGGLNYELIDITWSEAVGLVPYTIVATESVSEDGEVSEEIIEQAIAAMENGSLDYDIAEDQGVYSFSFAYNGNYTFIAASYKAENDGTYTFKGYDYVSFEYDNGDPNIGWDSLGYVEYTDGYVTSSYFIQPATYYVEVQLSQDYEEYYRLVNPYGADFPYNEPGDWNAKKNSYLYFDMYDPNMVFVEMSPQTLNWGRGVLSCFSLAANELYGGASPEDIIKEGLNGTLEDDVVTFPFNTLMVGWDDSWYYANFALDLELYQTTGKQDYLYGPDGKPIAPFKIDFNTLTDDPMAAAMSRPAHLADMQLNTNNLKKMDNFKMNPRKVKYTAKQKPGKKVVRRKPYRTAVFNNPVKRVKK